MFLPKSRVNYRTIKATLMSLYKTRVAILEENDCPLFQDVGTHLIVPRNYMSKEELEGIEILPWPGVPFPKRSIIECPCGPRDQIQFDALDEITANYPDDGILNLACGKGKTAIALFALGILQVPTFVVVNTEDIMEGWRDEILGNEERGIPKKTNLTSEDVGRIQGPECTWKGKKIVLCMLHTLAGRSDTWTEELRKYPGLIIFDECHRLSAEEFSKAASIFYGPRLGLTATIQRPDRMEFVFQYHLGEVVYQNLEQDLTPRYVFLKVPTMIPPGEEAQVQDQYGKFNAPKFCTWVSRNRLRNRYIAAEVRRAIDHGRNILVLTHSRDHTEILRQMVGEGGVIHGMIQPASLRRQILFDNRVVFATFQLVKEGLNKPELDTLLCVTPFSGEKDPLRRSISLTQAPGRICRKKEGKAAPVVIIFEDHRIRSVESKIRSLKIELTNQNLSYTSKDCLP